MFVVRSRVVALAVATALLGLSACSEDHDAPAPDAASPTATADDAGRTQVAPEPPAPGPLEEFVGYAGPRTAEEWLVQIAWRENATAACMAEQGFAYTPQVPAVDQIEYVEGPAQGSREFVERWGYGVWGQPPNGGGGGFMYSGTVDPNWAARETMSEAGREAYDTALWGPVTEVHEDGSISREGGCSGAAETPVGPEAAYLAGVRKEALDFLEAMGADSRFADVDAAWASCMADGGLGYANPAAAQQQFWDEMMAETEDGILDADVAAERAPEEVRIAVADLDCQEATDWPARHRAIEIALQQEYVDAHRADLDSLAAAMAAAPVTP